MQQEVQHQMMGYDRASIVFSPDGRLLQVEYAKKAVEQGTTALGIVCKNGVLLMADKRIVDRFIVPKSVEKIFKVDEHIGATATGYLMDGRVLIEKAQIMAQQHRVTYDSRIDTASLVKEICNIKQAYTQYGGARPFGVSLLFAGIDEDGPKLFETEPTGIFFQYKAAAIGESETEAEELMKKKYREDMTLEEGLKLAISVLKKILGRNFDINRIDGSFIKTSTRRFERLKEEEIAELVKKVK